MAKSAPFTVHSNEFYSRCEAELVIRPGKRGPFLGCSQYPACDYACPLKSLTDRHIVKVLEGQICPTRGANLILRQGRFGIFIGRISYPECEHAEPIDKPDEMAITYPQRRTGHLVQRYSHYSKTFHSCDRYPKCQFAINFKSIAGECPECHYLLLTEKKAAQGVKHFCTNKQCGEPVSTE